LLYRDHTQEDRMKAPEAAARLAALLCALALAACGGELAPEDEGSLEAALDEDPQSTEVEVGFPERDGPVGERAVWLEDQLEHFAYLSVGGHDVVEGDMLLPGSAAHRAELAEDDPDGAAARSAMGAAVAKAARWPGAVIAYAAPKLGTTLNSRIYAAMKRWTDTTPVRFVRRSSQTDYLVFSASRDGLCSSYVGRVGGPQRVYLSSKCIKGAFTHELGHALGLFHEQSRANRDSTISIHWANIQSGREHNFRTYKQMGVDGVDIGKYDYGSLMHYSSWAFSRNGKPTITKRSGGLIYANRAKPSASDISTVKTMYR
jgi:hypothetical protein